MLTQCVAEKTLQAYADGRLDNVEVAQVEQHLESCEQCCVVLSQIVDLDGSRLVGNDTSRLDPAPVDTNSSHGPAYHYWKQRTPAATSDQQPLMIGRYRIERLLGSGGFGRVYLAFDDLLERRIAIKVSHAEAASSPEQLTLIRAEAKTVASLDHPNIVPIYDVGGTPEFPIYLVSKLIDGQNLACKMRDGVTVAEAVAWTLQISEALTYAHSRGVIHRDIKPQNILIDGSGSARLTDFGLAWRSSDNQGKHPTAGTPAYMSPEQRTGHPIDHRTDIYSLGMVLSELLSQVRDSGKTSINEELADLCRRAMAELPDNRYATAQEFSQELSRYASSPGWSEQHLGDLSLGSVATRTLTDWRSWLAAVSVMGIVILLATAWRTSEARRRESANIDAYLKSDPAQLQAQLKLLSNLSPVGLTSLRQAVASADADKRLRGQLALLKQQPELAIELTHAMIDAPIELASTIGQALLPHREAIKQELIAVFRNEAKSRQCRLNASCWLAQAFAQDTFWEDPSVPETVVRLLNGCDLGELNSYVRAHCSVKDSLVKFLRATAMSNEMRSDPKLARHFEIWEQLVRDDIDGCIVLLLECPVEIADRILTHVKNKPYVIDKLRSVLAVNQENTQDPTAALLYHAQFMAAYSLMRLGSTEEFWRLWEHSQSPDLTTVATFVVADSPITLSLLADRLLESDLLEPISQMPQELNERLFSRKISSRRQIIHALFRSSKWMQIEQDKCNKIVTKLETLVYQDADPAIHAHAFWILRALSPPETWESEPWFPKDQINSSDEHKVWSINSQNMVMIKIDGAEEFDHPFAVSQREVECRQFEQFVKETSHQWAVPKSFAETNKQPNDWAKPQNFVSWFDCAAYCNWLSRREGLEECYLPNEEGKFAAGMSTKPDVTKLNGYRLPLNAEWELCCRAGAKTRFASGDLERYLLGYGWTNRTSREVSPTGHLPPNALGFFDMHGNVGEWILNVEGADETQQHILENSTRRIRGGDFQSDPVDASCERTADLPASAQRRTIGFRVARTLK